MPRAMYSLDRSSRFAETGSRVRYSGQRTGAQATDPRLSPGTELPDSCRLGSLLRGSTRGYAADDDSGQGFEMCQCSKIPPFSRGGVNFQGHFHSSTHASYLIVGCSQNRRSSRPNFECLLFLKYLRSIRGQCLLRMRSSTHGCRIPEDISVDYSKPIHQTFTPLRRMLVAWVASVADFCTPSPKLGESPSPMSTFRG